MDSYGLRGESWWEEMYQIRESWILAYYKDSFMSGLMKTTFRSESINTFFRVYANVWTHKQRRKHCELEVQTRTTNPRMLSPSKQEAHVRDTYTRTIFLDIQKEMNKAAWFCTLKCVDEQDEKKVYEICHYNKQHELKDKYTVGRIPADETFDCSCNNFVRNGILCRHAFSVMIYEKVTAIPQKYILRRWRRGLVPVEKQRLINKAVTLFDRLIAMARNDKDSLELFAEQLEDLCEEMSMNTPLLSSQLEKQNDIVELVGASQPDSVEVEPPSGIRNKGCGTGKRLVSSFEKAAKKLKRKGRICKKLSKHDSRNCPEKFRS